MSEALKPVRWGIVGLGWVANDFVGPAMQKNPGSDMVACLGSTPEKTRAYAEKFGVKTAHANLEALMHDSNVDAVYIALPNVMHHEAVLLGAAQQFQSASEFHRLRPRLPN